MSNKVIVTRHPALVEYLNNRGVYGAVIDHATAEQVVGRHVFGVLPHRLSCLAAAYTEVPLHLPAELRGQELTLEQVERYAQPVQTYRVVRLA